MRSALCPRRAGKTFACAALIAYQALTRPGSKIIYLCLTSGQAADNLWGYLKKFSQDFELSLKFNETKLRAKFANGSTVQLAGAETRKEIDKLRGGSFGLDLVVIDECKSFQERVLSELIWEVLKPALSDRSGSLVVIGTPGNILSGPFYEATVTERPNEKAPVVRPWVSRASHTGRFTWSFHTWTSKQNTALPQIWHDALALKAERGLADEDPVWLREYLGQWCASDSLLVYKYLEARNSWVPDPESSQFGLPQGHDWKFVLGLDIGFNDATAITVGAYADTHPHLYHVYDFKQPHLSVDSIEKAVRETIARFGEFEGMVADTGGLGKTVVATLNERGLYFEAAEKREKYDHIELVNSDLLSGRIRILPDSYLASEMTVLQWEDSTYKKEDKSTDNHACFAPGCLVQTSTGFKPIETVAVGDLVLTHTGKYKPVTAALSRYFEGQLVSIEAPTGEKFRCTDNHPFYMVPVGKCRTDGLTGQLRPTGEWDWRRADSLEGTAIATAKVVETETRLDKYEALMLGYYAAEGSCSHSAGVVEFAGHSDENRILPLLEKGLPGVGLPSLTRSTPKNLRVKREGDSRRASFSSVELCAYLKGTGKLTDKKLHPDCMLLTGEAALYCLAGYVYGDGHFQKEGKSVISSSVSRELAYQIASVARSAGIPCSLRKQLRAGRWQGIRGPIKNDCWVVSFSTLDFIPKLPAELRTVFLDKRNFPTDVDPNTSRVGCRNKEIYGRSCVTGVKPVTEPERYVGKVYTLEVADDHSYTVNGLVTKNCDAWLYLWRYAHHHLWTPAKVSTPKESLAWFEELDDRAAADRVARRAAKGLDNLGTELTLDDQDFWVH